MTSTIKDMLIKMLLCLFSLSIVITAMMTPIHASEKITFDLIMEQTEELERYIEIGDRENAEELALIIEAECKAMPKEVYQQFIDNGEYEIPSSVPKTQTRSVSVASGIAMLIGLYGITTTTCYEFGKWCRNHNVEYWAGQGALFAAFGGIGNLTPMRIVYAMYYDNGWNAA